MERRHDALGQHAGAEPAGRPSRDAAIEDQLHLIGTTDIQILAHDLFEETAAGQRPIEDLGQGELGLQDREVVPIPGLAMRCGKGMGESAQPFAKDRVDLGGVQRVGDPLHAAGGVARTDPIVQRLERHLPLGQLAL